MQGERRLLPAVIGAINGVTASHSLSTIAIEDLFGTFNSCSAFSVLAGWVGGGTFIVPPPTCEIMIMGYNATMIMTPPTCEALSTIVAVQILVSVPGQS